MNRLLFFLSLAASLAAFTLGPSPVELSRFLASGFRTTEFQRPTTQRFVQQYSQGVAEAKNAASRQVSFEDYAGVLRGSLQESMRAANGPNLEQVQRYGVPGRSTTHYDLQAMGASPEALRAFAHAALEAVNDSGSPTSILADPENGHRVEWRRTNRMLDRSGRIVAEIPGVTVQVYYAPGQPVGSPKIAEVRLVYPNLSELDRAFVEARMEQLYATAVNPASFRSTVDDAAYEIAWWMLSTVFYDHGSTSMAKGVIASLTGNALAVAGSGEDIDLIAMRTRASQFRRAVTERFPSGPCKSCACHVHRTRAPSDPFVTAGN